VALTYEYKCSDPEHPGYSGKDDAAANYSNPWEQGQTDEILGPRAGCEGGITAAIWADGKELGNPKALQGIHDCRTVAREEIHLALEGEILATPTSQWDPARSIAKLKVHHADLKQTIYTDDAHAAAMRGCQASEVSGLILDIEDFQKNSSREPDKYATQKGDFLRYLLEMEQALGSPTYPTIRTWWKHS
jgi:hypothetical protein